MATQPIPLRKRLGNGKREPFPHLRRALLTKLANLDPQVAEDLKDAPLKEIRAWL